MVLNKLCGSPSKCAIAKERVCCHHNIGWFPSNQHWCPPLRVSPDLCAGLPQTPAKTSYARTAGAATPRTVRASAPRGSVGSYAPMVSCGLGGVLDVRGEGADGRGFLFTSPPSPLSMKPPFLSRRLAFFDRTEFAPSMTKGSGREGCGRGLSTTA